MRGKTAWSCSATAFEASRSERLPHVLRHVLVRIGVGCFWAALALEGRAVEVWREQRAQRNIVRRLRRAEAWAACKERLARLRDLLDWRSKSLCQPAFAWSLPDSPKMRGLGLGRMWAVLCPYCNEFHTHSPGEGRRTPHCCGEQDRRHYVLEFSGLLPVEYRTRFYRSSKSGLPRLLHRWPEPSLEHSKPSFERPEPVGLLAA
jgi:hypothetical protein